MVDFEASNAKLSALLERVDAPRAVSEDEPLFCGLDVGTAFIVLAVVDASGDPVACAYRFASVVKDGMVVDYIGAVDIARELKEELEGKLGRELEQGAVALPPGTENLDGGVVKNVAEGAGLDVSAVFDEPTAANLLIGTRDGAVVDIGGGTTGISVFQDGTEVECIDESTGGTHFSLVLAGAKGISFDEAELYKRDPAHHKEIFPVVKPTIDKVANIVSRAIEGYDVPEVILVGGTSELTGIEAPIEKQLGIPVVKPNHPMFVTPLGIALGCMKAAAGELDA